MMILHPGPAFSVADLHDGYLRAFRDELGIEIVSFNLGDRLSFYSQAAIDGVRAFTPEQAVDLASKGVESALYEWMPDIVVVISGFYFQPALYELMKIRGHKVVLVHTESPYEDDRQIVRAPYVDLNIVNDPTNLRQFKAANPRSFYLPHAYDPTRHFPRPGKAEHRSDMAIVGTGYPSRIEFLEAVDWTGIDLALAGNWAATSDESPLRKFLCHDLNACCDNEEAVDLYVATKMSANMYRKEATREGLQDGWAIGPREVELAATETFFLREPRGEGDELFPMLPTFGSPEDFEEKMRYWLPRDVERKELAQQARAAITERTFKNNAIEILRLLGE